MAVEVVVGLLLHKLDHFLFQLAGQGRLLSGLRGEVEEIKDELQSMRAFLKDADAREDTDQGAKDWANQVRELAYDVEDVLDEFLLQLGRPPQRGFLGFLHKLKHLRATHRIISSTERIKTRVLSVSERSQRYQFNSSINNGGTRAWHDPRADALLIEESELVGIDKPRNDLVELLVEGESKLGVVSVVGMGGLGKTTLVKKVFDEMQVQGFFKHHAWITVSESFKIKQILIDLIFQLLVESNQPVPQGVDTLSDSGLKLILKEFLREKRYVIVFDDIWSTHAWEALKYALPDGNCGSRIVVTTRFTDIASFCKESYGHVYNLEPLKLEDAWTLFCKNTFPSNHGHFVPPDVEEVSQNILRRCEGLPLAIRAIGGLLSTKYKGIEEWQRVYHGLGAELENNDKLTSLRKILLLSYHDLPYHLKPCFLYLSIFPEDYAILRMRVIRLWIAEGFVEEKAGSIVEEVAEDYLYELSNRNLIQVTQVDSCRRIRKFQVHDLLREIIGSISREQNFTISLVERSPGLHDKVRRLSIHRSGENVTENRKLTCMRSLFIFCEDKFSYSSIPFHGFKLLRVLDLEGTPFEVFPSEFVNLTLLRYLSLRRTNIKSLPNSIGKLQNLETLDCKQTYVSNLPIDVVKLQKLRHLLVYRYDTDSCSHFTSQKGIKAPEGIKSLVALQKLSFIEANDCNGTIKELGKLEQLRRLGVVKLRKEDGFDLCFSIKKMPNLRSLDVTSVNEEELLDLQSLSSPPMLLQRLHMQGRLEKLPHWIPLLLHLVKLRLGWSRLRDEPLQGLQDLPNLVELRFYWA